MIVVHPSAVQMLSIETPETKRVRSDPVIGSTLQLRETECEEVLPTAHVSLRATVRR